jgi:hypothetical protein
VKKNMAEENQLMESLLGVIHNESNNNPAPKKCTITKVYDDNAHIDVDLFDDNKLTYIKSIGRPSGEEDAILVFLENNEQVVIPEGLEIYDLLGLNDEESEGINIGGLHFDTESNELSPLSRVTCSITTINEIQYALIGILDNAYHNLTGCDDNTTYSWFVGLKTPVTDNRKDNENTSFVVMYNTTTDSDTHTIDNNNWNIVFEVNKNGVTQ